MSRPNLFRPTSLALLLVLGACGPLVQIGGNDAPPAALLTIRAANTGPQPAIDLRARPPVIVAIPNVPGPLQTLRLPVTTGDTSLQYMTGAQWAEQPNRQFAILVADVIGARGQAVLDARAGGLAGARALSGTLLEFGLDVRAAPVARIRYDAVFSDAKGVPIAARRFEATEPVAAQTPEAVVAALNAAANRMAGEIASWIGER